MKDTVKIVGGERVRLKLKNLPKNILSKAIMSEIGSFLMTSIKTRTLTGYDFKDRRFKKYSPKYKFLRNKKGLPTNIVDLFFTGSMMSSMTFEAQKEEVRLFFMSTTDKHGSVNSEKAFYVNRLRKFFALSVDDAKEVNRLLQEHVRKTL